jgi:fluoride exporter
MTLELPEPGYVAIGGCCGSLLRYLITGWIPSLPGTFIVNFAGSVAIGFLMYESVYLGGFSRQTRLLFGAGVIGSFTTFSAFAAQTLTAGPVWGLISVIAHLCCGLAGVSLGRHIIISQRGPGWKI